MPILHEIFFWEKWNLSHLIFLPINIWINFHLIFSENLSCLSFFHKISQDIHSIKVDCSWPKDFLLVINCFIIMLFCLCRRFSFFLLLLSILRTIRRWRTLFFLFVSFSSEQSSNNKKKQITFLIILNVKSCLWTVYC